VIAQSDRGKDGLVIVDKEPGWTSHDVVARLRRIAGTRRVGHAGTLDPMATGVLILGINQATRLLGHLASKRKSYNATIRLGSTTITDDAAGEILDQASHDQVMAISEAQIAHSIEVFRGSIWQRPSAVSAIKIDGVRSYARVRAGEEVVLPERQVTIYRFDFAVAARTDSYIDLSATVECSSGTYIRALARDLGAALGIGGHLTRLRRTSVDSFTLEEAHKIGDYEREFSYLPMAEVARRAFPIRMLDEEEGRNLSHGRALAPSESDDVIAAISVDNHLLALIQNRLGQARPLAVFSS